MTETPHIFSYSFFSSAENMVKSKWYHYFIFHFIEMNLQKQGEESIFTKSISFFMASSCHAFGRASAAIVIAPSVTLTHINDNTLFRSRIYSLLLQKYIIIAVSFKTKSQRRASMYARWDITFLCVCFVALRFFYSKSLFRYRITSIMAMHLGAHTLSISLSLSSYEKVTLFDCSQRSCPICLFCICLACSSFYILLGAIKAHLFLYEWLPPNSHEN